MFIFQQHWRTLIVLFAVLIAFFCPHRFVSSTFVYTDSSVFTCVWILFFLQGLSIPAKELRAGFRPMRLHSFILAWNFLLFPLLVLTLLSAVGGLLRSELLLGFGLLAFLPTTVASATLFTALCRGHVANALFASVYSNVIGIFLLPVLTVVYFSFENTVSIPVWPLLSKLGFLIVLPLSLAQLMRRMQPVKAEQIDRSTKYLNSIIIAVIVHIAFAQSIYSGLLETIEFSELVVVLFVCIFLICIVSVLVWQSLAWLGCTRPEKIAGFFCASQKSLCTGLPLAISILSSLCKVPETAVILIPLLCYYPLQLLFAGLLSQKLQRT